MELEAMSPQTATKPEPAPVPDFIAYRKALIPLDGSIVAEGIIPHAMKVARALDLELVLVQVVLRVPPQVMEGRHEVVDHTDRLCQEAEQYLSGVAEGLRARGMRVETVVRVGEPAPEIVGAAREAGVDLIAMTTHGRSGLSRLLFGSVAEAVLRRAHVPLLLLPLREGDVTTRAA
jgi:nucleotide-binding universal stress UspA family protein